MTQLFYDDFNRADGAIGGSWTSSTGTVDVSTNQMRFHTNNSQVRLPVPNDAKVDLVVTLPSGPGMDWTAGQRLDIHVRSSLDRSNSMYFRFQCGVLGTAYAAIHRVVAGVDVVLVEQRQFATPAGGHTLSVRCQGEQHALYLDSNLIVMAIDSVVASGDYMFIFNTTLDKTFFDSCDISDVLPMGMYVWPHSILPGIDDQVVDLGGVDTQWTPGTPGDPEFTVSDGSITAQTIHTVDSASITIDAPVTPTIINITDPNYGRVAYLTVAATSVPYIVPNDKTLNFILLTLLNRVAGIDLILAYLGQHVDHDYIQRILDELGITDDEIPTAGNVKALAADLAATLHEVLDYSDDPTTTLRKVVVDVLAELYTIDGTPNVVTLPQILTAIGEVGGSEAVIEAIEGVAAQVLAAQTSLNLISTNDTVDIADARNDISLLAVDVGVVGADLAVAQADLDAIRTGSDYTLGTVGNWLLGIGSLQAVTLAAVIASVLGRGTATALQVVDVVTDVVAAGTDLEGIVTVILTWLGNMQQPTLPTISVDLGGIVNDITGVHDDLAADVTTITDAISGHDTDIKSRLDAIEGKIDELIAGGTGGGATPPAWPGIELVTLGAPVAITQDMSIAGPLDGILWEITGFAQPPPAYTIGDRTSYSKLGIAAFVTDEGDAERFQTVSFDAGIIIPQSILRPAACVIHWRVGVEGNVVPWTVT